MGFLTAAIVSAGVNDAMFQSLIGIGGFFNLIAFFAGGFHGQVSIPNRDWWVF